MISCLSSLIQLLSAGFLWARNVPTLRAQWDTGYRLRSQAAQSLEEMAEKSESHSGKGLGWRKAPEAVGAQSFGSWPRLSWEKGGRNQGHRRKGREECSRQRAQHVQRDPGMRVAGALGGPWGGWCREGRERGTQTRKGSEPHRAERLP